MISEQSFLAEFATATRQWMTRAVTGHTGRGLALVVSLVVITPTGPVDAATHRYKVQPLGVLDGTTNSYAADINDLGQVVGYSIDPARAFIWESGQGMTDLGSPPDSFARAVNNHGQVVGEMRQETGIGLPIWQSFQWERDTGLVDLRDLPGNPPLINVTDINDAGDILGSTPSFDEVLYRPGQGTIELGFNAISINNLGQVVGSELIRPMETRAVIWTEESGAVQLPHAPDDAPVNVATGINEQGQVLVGTSAPSGGAFLWDPSFGYVDLGILSDANFSRAEDINEAGVIVGFGFGGKIVGQSAFVWEDAKGIQPLDDLIDPRGGWIVEHATAINEQGQIVGWGRRDGGRQQALLLTPIPVPAALPLLLGAVLALLGLRARRFGA